MNSLKNIGLDKNLPTETILSTFSEEGEPHMAAIGVRRIGENKIKLKLFTDTETYKNIKRMKAGIINIISDAKFLIEQGLQNFLSSDTSYEIKESEIVEAPYIAEADATIEFETEEIEEKTVTDEIGTSEFAKVIGSVKNVVKKEKIKPKTFKRPELYLIEVAVLATKAIEANEKGKNKTLENYINEISYYEEKCKKIAPESEESKNISKIKEHILSNEK